MAMLRHRDTPKKVVYTKRIKRILWTVSMVNLLIGGCAGYFLRGL